MYYADERITISNNRANIIALFINGSCKKLEIMRHITHTVSDMPRFIPICFPQEEWLRRHKVQVKESLSIYHLKDFF